MPSSSGDADQNSVGNFGSLLFTLSLSAQERRQPGRPGAAASIGVITETINSCERSTNAFVGELRRALRSSSVGEDREDDLNRAARSLELSMDRVGRAWNKDKSIEDTRRHVEDALRDAKNVNVTMRSRRLGGTAESRWADVRRELNLLARAFRLPSIRW